MLPTKQATIGLYKTNKTLSLASNKNIDTFVERDYVQPQHLYFTDDNEIKEGDWVANTKYPIDDTDKPLGQADFTASALNGTHWKKVIATTNPELWNKNITCPNCNGTKTTLSGNHCNRCNYSREIDVITNIAKIDNDFIQAYIKNYNEGNVITEVMLEYEGETQYTSNHHYKGVIDKLKLRPNGSVIIHKVKENPFDKLLGYAEQMYKEQEVVRDTYDKTINEFYEHDDILKGMDRIIQLIKRQNNVME